MRRVHYMYIIRWSARKEEEGVYYLLSRYIDYCNSLVATVLTVTRPQS